MQISDQLPGFRFELNARHIVQGAAASRDWQPLHHDHQWARDKAGTGDIILNTPSQVGWMLRYVTDVLGPDCRPGAIRLRMKRPLLPGSALVFGGTVVSDERDSVGLRWLCIDVTIAVGERIASQAQIMLALPDPVSPWTISPWQPREMPRD
ncbi:MAG TPA: hypothetical protein VL027_02030 [Spongiibacteraceae bacterium]|nr:hypothetical protein [Spongiibacteraceae bacterium]